MLYLFLIFTLNISFKYDVTSNRWKNVRLPTAGSIVAATATFEDVSGDEYDHPLLNLLDISYGAASDAVTQSPTRAVGHRGPQR